MEFQSSSRLVAIMLLSKTCIVDYVLQDTICTPSLGMDTTCGSFALKGAKALKDAAVVDLLIKAGMIVIAKTNLTVRLYMCKIP